MPHGLILQGRSSILLKSMHLFPDTVNWQYLVMRQLNSWIFFLKKRIFELLKKGLTSWSTLRWSMFSEAQSCQSCIFRSAIFLPCSLHAVTRQMKCTHCRLSFECCYRRHNNRHQSELPERGPASSRPDPCCLLLIPAQTCPHRRHQNLVTQWVDAWGILYVTEVVSSIYTLPVH